MYDISKGPKIRSNQVTTCKTVHILVCTNYPLNVLATFFVMLFIHLLF